MSVTEEAPGHAGTSASVDLCPGSAPIDLFTLLGGAPQAGGTWTHPGGVVFSGVFDPGSDPSGDQVYSIAGNTCPDVTTIVTVNVLPGPDAGDDNAISACNTQTPFSMLSQLLGAPDADGAWTDASGSAVSGTDDPSQGIPGTATYTVQDGDSLWQIVTTFYGPDATRVAQLYEANRDVLPSAQALQVGMTLNLPPLE